MTEYQHNYCVGIVDTVHTGILKQVTTGKKRDHYFNAFLNSISSIVKECGGVVSNPSEDTLLYYFPKTNTSEISSFMEPLECGMKIIDAHSIVNSKMREEGFPDVDYKISSDYGLVMTSQSENSSIEDIFGTTVNLIAKMNMMNVPNTMVIGENLYQKVRHFKNYRFKEEQQFRGSDRYPFYSITRSKT